MKKFLQKNLELFMAVFVALVYLVVKTCLGFFMSDDMSWTGLSLLITYVIYDVIKSNGTKE